MLQRYQDDFCYFVSSSQSIFLNFPAIPSLDSSVHEEEDKNKLLMWVALRIALGCVAIREKERLNVMLPKEMQALLNKRFCSPRKLPDVRADFIE